MATQLEKARSGQMTEEMKQVAQDEALAAELVLEKVAAGDIISVCGFR